MGRNHTDQQYPLVVHFDICLEPNSHDRMQVCSTCGAREESDPNECSVCGSPLPRRHAAQPLAPRATSEPTSASPSLPSERRPAPTAAPATSAPPRDHLAPPPTANAAHPHATTFGVPPSSGDASLAQADRVSVLMNQARSLDPSVQLSTALQANASVGWWWFLIGSGCLILLFVLGLAIVPGGGFGGEPLLFMMALLYGVSALFFGTKGLRASKRAA